MDRILENDEIVDREIQSQILTREGEDGETISTSETYFLAIVKPTQVSKPTKEQVSLLLSSTPGTLIQELWEVLGEGDSKVALDLETNTLDVFRSDARIVCIGLSSAYKTSCIWTFDWTDEDERWGILGEFLTLPQLELIGHNVSFDSHFLQHKMGGTKLNWVADTLGAYRQLANEGYGIQNSAYGLKQAQLDLLGWQSKGSEELEEWLVSHGFFKGNAKEGLTEEELRQRFKEGKLRADKGAMFNAPPEILAYYCALDAYSTWALLHHVFYPSTAEHSFHQRFWDYHKLFMENVSALSDSYLSGILIDAEKMDRYLLGIENAASASRQAFLEHPDLRPLIEDYRLKRLAAYKKEEPAQYKALPKLGEEPPQFKKNGQIGQNWIKWKEKKDNLESGALLEVSNHWLEWKAKMEKMEKDELFNLNSNPMRKWLFYEKLGFPILSKTEKGSPDTGKSALKHWGEYGQILSHYNEKTKEAQLVRACLGVLKDHGEGNWRLHPQFKAPGTFTGRLAGGSTETRDGEGRFNVQQIPKKKGYLETWIPDRGCVFVDCDHSALEPVVLTALSGDKTMMGLYGPDAKPNDVYLYFGSRLPIIGKAIRDAGYEPENPTPEAIANAKKLAKKERSISKTVVLGSQYGMGARKLRENLALDGVKLSESEAFSIWRAYWDSVPGVVAYRQKLEIEYTRNGGFILNAFGRPICCDSNLLKDLLNRNIQSSGHDFHMLFISILQDLRREHLPEMQGIIWDFHDQSIVQVPEEKAELMVELFKESYEILNRKIKELNPSFLLDLKGEPQIVRSMAEAKIQE